MLLQQNQIWKNSSQHKRQSGVVIVVALFIVALVAAMAYFMMARLERDTRRTMLILRDTQAGLYAQGSVAWAEDQLKMNMDAKKPDKMVDAVPIKSGIVNENNYVISSTIYDMQSNFNLNNLSANQNQDDAKRFIKFLLPKLSDQQIDELIKAIADWVSPGNVQNEYNRYYANLARPYRTSHHPMVSVSELRLVKGMTPEIYAALSPYVTALPFATQINVQSADVPVLILLSPSMTFASAQSIVEQRKTNPIVDPNKFVNTDVAKNNNITASKLTVVSNYFLLETEVSIENQHIVFYTLLERVATDKATIVNVVWQSKGTW